jgi:hypothetical protein
VTVSARAALLGEWMVDSSVVVMVGLTDCIWAVQKDMWTDEARVELWVE